MENFFVFLFVLLFMLFAIGSFSVARKFVSIGYNRLKVRLVISLVVGLEFIVLMQIVNIGSDLNMPISDQIFIILLVAVAVFLASYGKGVVDLLEPIDIRKLVSDIKNIKNDIKTSIWMIVSVAVIPLVAIGLPFLIIYLLSR